MTLLLLQVRDGPMPSSPLLGTYCGAEIPPRLQSTQRSMYIRFVTDSSVSNYGFEAAYDSALKGENSNFSVEILAKLYLMIFSQYTNMYVTADN